LIRVNESPVLQTGARARRTAIEAGKCRWKQDSKHAANLDERQFGVCSLQFRNDGTPLSLLWLSPSRRRVLACSLSIGSMEDRWGKIQDAE
jgi:hypothetical protein